MPNLNWFSERKVSIHAPVKGATNGAHRAEAEVQRFNSRSREGSD